MNFESFAKSSFGSLETKKKKKQQVKKKPKVKQESDSEDDFDEEQHQKELQALAEKDPEFFAHLKSEGGDLLQFGNEEEDEDEEQQEQQQLEEEDEGEDRVSGNHDTSAASIAKLEKKAFEKMDLSSVRKAVRLFRDAVKSEQVIFPSVEAYHSYISTSLERMRLVLLTLLKSEKIKSDDKILKFLNDGGKSVSFHSAWMKTFLDALNKSIVSNKTAPSLQLFILQQCSEFMVFFCLNEFKSNVGRKFFNSLILVFNREETEKENRIAAFFRLRQLLALLSTSPNNNELCESLMKSLYVTFAKSVTKASSNMERVKIQLSCLVEVFKVNFAVSYKVCFVYVRQLALHVRTALANKSKENVGSVVNFQFLYCTKLLGEAISSSPQLYELFFPLVQVLLASLSLILTIKQVPFLFHVVAMINKMALRMNKFVPIHAKLLWVFSLPVFQEIRKEKQVNSKLPKLDNVLRISEEEIRASKEAKVAVVNRAAELLEESLIGFRSNIAFPEMWFPIRTALQGVMDAYSRLEEEKKERKNKNEWNVVAILKLGALVKKGDGWANVIVKLRNGENKSVKVPNGPSDLSGCVAFESKVRSIYYSQEEESKSKKRESDELDVVSEKKMMKKPKREVIVEKEEDDDEDEEEDDDDDDGEEDKVTRLNPLDF